MLVKGEFQSVRQLWLEILCKPTANGVREHYRFPNYNLFIQLEKVDLEKGRLYDGWFGYGIIRVWVDGIYRICFNSLQGSLNKDIKPLEWQSLHIQHMPETNKFLHSCQQSQCDNLFIENSGSESLASEPEDRVSSAQISH